MRFNYQARTQEGEIQSGIIEASSKEAALSLLQRYKLFVTTLEKAEFPAYARKIKLFERVSRKEIVSFSRQLSIMFKSQIPLLEALRVLASQIKNFSFKEKILTLSEDIEGGTPLSQALTRYPKLFSDFYVSMVKSGEASGTLSESFDYVAEHLEREHHFYSRLQGAMIYPALIVVMMIIVLIAMMFFIIPDLIAILKETGQTLPLLTKVVIAFSDFFRKWFLVLFLAFLGLIIFIFNYSKTQNGKRLLDRTYLRLPLIGSFLRRVYLSRFGENLSTLMSGGLPIVQALQIIEEIVGNDVYQKIVSRVGEEVRRGEQMSSVLVQYPEEFPPMFTQMILIGERTGTLDKSLMYVVDFYQKEVNQAVDNLLAILEPILIIFLGVVVGGLMAAILMPLYRMAAI